MIKRILVILMLLAMSLNMVAALETSALSAIISSYEPQPASPGKYVTVYVKLENEGSGAAKNVILRAIPEFPFSIDAGQKTEEDIGILAAQSAHIAEFRVKVDENAVQGSNNFKITYNLDDDQETWATQELALNVQTLDAVLSISKAISEPKEIDPGKTGKIIIEIENLADSLLTDIKLQIDLSSDNIPLAPIGSVSEKNIYQLKPSEKKELVFDVIALPSASANIYKVPFELTYYDNVGTEYNKSDIFGIRVNSEPEISVMIDSTNILKEKKHGNIILKVVNKGLSDVKLMTLKMTQTDDYEILSATNEEYIGNIDSDDFETVEFDVFLKKDQDTTIPLEIEYRDNNNKEFKEKYELVLKVRSNEQLGNGNGKSWVVWFIIIIIVAGIIIYRRRKKRKKH